jgi:hypothetical protein
VRLPEYLNSDNTKSQSYAYKSLHVHGLPEYSPTHDAKYHYADAKSYQSVGPNLSVKSWYEVFYGLQKSPTDGHRSKQ